MSILAKKHVETRFVKIHAEKSPFLAERLKIVVLPTLALIKNAKVDDYVVCFMEIDTQLSIFFFFGDVIGFLLFLIQQYRIRWDLMSLVGQMSSARKN